MVYGGVLDQNDVRYVTERGFDALFAQPAPLSQDDRQACGYNINPHMTRFGLIDGRVLDVFHVKPIYYHHRNDTWRPLSEVVSHYGNKKIVLRPEALDLMHPSFLRWLQQRMELVGGKILLPSTYQVNHFADVSKTILFAVLTAYPDAHPESTTVDGEVRNQNSNYATCRAATSGDASNDSSDRMEPTHTLSGSTYIIKRCFTLFNTAAIGAAATIESAIQSMYLWIVDANANSNSWNIYASTPDSNTVIVTDDFDQVGSTAFSDTAVAINGPVGYNDFAFNATGVAALAPTGITKTGMRVVEEVSASAPTAGNGNLIYSSERAGTSEDPKLAVTYSLGGAASPLFMFSDL